MGLSPQPLPPAQLRDKGNRLQHHSTPLSRSPFVPTRAGMGSRPPTRDPAGECGAHVHVRRHGSSNIPSSLTSGSALLWKPPVFHTGGDL